MNIKIGLLGLGNVGAGVYQLITNHQEQLTQTLGTSIEIAKILVRDISKPRGIELPSQILTNDYRQITQNPDIDIVIEVLGGIDSTKQMIEDALIHKKHVVTANKDLLALYGVALTDLARDNGCDLYYEASVGGGIPIIRSLVDGLVSDKITKMLGIINGTTNFILTKMSQEGKSYEDALKEAQLLGFAEPDPTSDVEGHDAARKMVILSSIAYSMPVNYEDVYVQGISKLTSDDIHFAKQLGYTIKLIGYASRENNAIEVSVQPTLVPSSHPLASVNNEYNAVYVFGEAVGQTMFYGPGAGGLPTATSIVADVVSVVRNMRMGVNGKSLIKLHNRKELKSKSDMQSKFFIRILVKDEVGIFAKITNIFADNHISFESLLQTPNLKTNQAEIIIITHTSSLQGLTQSLKKMGTMTGVEKVQSCYRIANLS